MNIDKEFIRKRALEQIVANGHRVATHLAEEFGLSRQGANGYLQSMVREGLIDAEGTTRARVYRIRPLTEVSQSYPSDGLQEDLVWRGLIAPVVARFPENVRHLWNYAATEMINNAIDHSGAPEVRVCVRENALNTEVIVTDEGVGIFQKIQGALNLLDPREAILELAKGKVTTAPETHTGEGIFFTSRALDSFEIESHHLRFNHSQRGGNSISEQAGDTPGTRVRMSLANDSARIMREVFEAFANPTFDKTVVPLRLAQYSGEKLISRSQAKRVAFRFERFKRIELDFAGVSEVGQAFADELFRVFPSAHPTIRIVPVNTEPAVALMIRRVVAASSAGKKSKQHS